MSAVWRLGSFISWWVGCITLHACLFTSASSQLIVTSLGNNVANEFIISTLSPLHLHMVASEALTPSLVNEVKVEHFFVTWTINLSARFPKLGSHLVPNYTSRSAALGSWVIGYWTQSLRRSNHIILRFMEVLDTFCYTGSVYCLFVIVLLLWTGILLWGGGYFLS